MDTVKRIASSVFAKPKFNSIGERVLKSQNQSNFSVYREQNTRSTNRFGKPKKELNFPILFYFRLNNSTWPLSLGNDLEAVKSYPNAHLIQPPVYITRFWSLFVANLNALNGRIFTLNIAKTSVGCLKNLLLIVPELSKE